jgi:hypothetical protein
MAAKKTLDLTQQYYPILLCAELVIGWRHGDKSMRLMGALERHLSIRIAMKHQQRHVEIGSVQSRRVEL